MSATALAGTSSSSANPAEGIGIPAGSGARTPLPTGASRRPDPGSGRFRSLGGARREFRRGPASPPTGPPRPAAGRRRREAVPVEVRARVRFDEILDSPGLRFPETGAKAPPGGEDPEPEGPDRAGGGSGGVRGPPEDREPPTVAAGAAFSAGAGGPPGAVTARFRAPAPERWRQQRPTNRGWSRRARGGHLLFSSRFAVGGSVVALRPSPGGESAGGTGRRRGPADRGRARTPRALPTRVRPSSGTRSGLARAATGRVGNTPSVESRTVPVTGRPVAGFALSPSRRQTSMMQTVENRPRPTETIVGTPTGTTAAPLTPKGGGGAIPGRIRGLDSCVARAESGGACRA